MATKLRIDLAQGILEVEGSETFVKTIYADFKAHFAGEEASAEPAEVKARSGQAKAANKRKTSKRKTAEPEPAPQPEPQPGVVPIAVARKPEPELKPEAEAEARGKAKTARLTVPSYTYIEELNLGATGDHTSLVEFMDSKLPITNEERNLVFLYYLQHILKLDIISPDHIYTCYKKANIRSPLNIENSLRVTASQKGWIQGQENGKMTVTPEGKLYVEKQLPKRVKG